MCHEIVTDLAPFLLPFTFDVKEAPYSLHVTGYIITCTEIIFISTTVIAKIQEMPRSLFYDVP